MRRRPGIQAEVLVSLAVIMLLATVVLTAVLVLQGESHLRSLLGRALLAEARSPRALGQSLVPGTEWWVVSTDGSVLPGGPVSGAIDAETRGLASEVRAAGNPLLRPGAVWEPIRFGAMRGDGTVVVARLPRSVSARMRAAPLGVAAAVLAADVIIFTAFGAYLLRRRVVLPLHGLAAAARSVGEGEPGARVPVEGTRETVDVAVAFNEMTEALERRSVELEKAVVHLRSTNRDLREARAGLDRAQRLAAVGRLAAGVAHEVGNPMGALLAFVEMGRRDSGITKEGGEHLEKAAREGERVRRILRQLLDFSRPPRATSTPFDLAAAANETVALLSAQRANREIDFRVATEEPLPAALGDPGAVSQILLNLLLNAADAVRGREQARVTVRVRGTVLHTREGEERGEAASHRRPDGVECIVSDDGPGISEPDRERIFDPFFTTKAVGEGTGLGLPNALRLAEELGGTIDYEPGEGGGAVFVLRLPAAAESAGSCEVRNAVRTQNPGPGDPASRKSD